MTTCLKPGFVPHGWVRGHAICVMKLNHRDMYGCVYGGVPLACRPDQLIDPMTVGRVDFRKEDMPDVMAWVKWWREPSEDTT